MYQILCYPLDDVAVTLRLLEISRKVNDKRFRNFASEYGIDLMRFNKAIQLKNHLMEEHSRYVSLFTYYKIYCFFIKKYKFKSNLLYILNLMVYNNIYFFSVEEFDLNAIQQ